MMGKLSQVVLSGIVAGTSPMVTNLNFLTYMLMINLLLLINQLLALFNHCNKRDNFTLPDQLEKQLSIHMKFSGI